jgi:hypothetical protein
MRNLLLESESFLREGLYMKVFSSMEVMLLLDRSTVCSSLSSTEAFSWMMLMRFLDAFSSTSDTNPMSFRDLLFKYSIEISRIVVWR